MTDVIALSNMFTAGYEEAEKAYHAQIATLTTRAEQAEAALAQLSTDVGLQEATRQGIGDFEAGRFAMLQSAEARVTALEQERDKLRAAIMPMEILADVHEVWNESDWCNESESDALESLAWQWFNQVWGGAS